MFCSISQELCRSYHQDFENDIYRCFSFFLFLINMVNTKISLFLLAHFYSFCNNYLFFKWINKCQKEILRCALPSSRECDFKSLLFLKTTQNENSLNFFLSIANAVWQNSCSGVMAQNALDQSDCRIL